jgi:ATP-binding cassette subfamily B multidrug efflux pump
MLWRLLRTYLRPYRRHLAAIVALQLLGTLASLYLPSLNARIIDRGVASGDTGVILSTGGVMLAVAALQIVCALAAVWFGARVAMSYGRDLRAAIFHRVGRSRPARSARFGAPSLITRTTNDVQQVQMLVLMSCTMLVAAPIMMRRRHLHGAARGRRLSWLLAVAVPVLGAASSWSIVVRMVPRFRAMQESHRHGQPDPARADHRHPGGAGVRARAATRRAVRRGQHDLHRHGAGRRPADGAGLPDRHAHLQRLVAVLWFGAHRIDTGPCRSAR